jgi:ribosomal-protein-alanine N-acetyltransferase
MSGVFIDLAGPVDAPALAALQQACFSHPWTLRQVEDEIAAGPPGGVLVARRGSPGTAVAILAACAYRVLADEAHVLDVAVAPAWRRRGLARRLVSLALLRSLRAGARVALLEVRAGNTAALALYASLGFEACGRRRGYYAEPAEDAILLAKRGFEASS